MIRLTVGWLVPQILVTSSSTADVSGATTFIRFTRVDCWSPLRGGGGAMIPAAVPGP